jgi:hypothetical protein
MSVKEEQIESDYCTVFIEYDGFNYILNTEDLDGKNQIILNDEMVKQLNKFIKKCKEIKK